MNSGKAIFNWKYYLPIASALLLFASIFPDYVLITNFIFLVPLLFFIENIKSGRDAIKGGLLFGIIAYSAIFYWMYALLSVSVFFGVLFFFSAIIYFSLVSVALVFLIYLIRTRWKIRFFLFLPFLWIILENLRSFGPFRFTGDHIANSMAVFPQLVQFIDLTGPYGVGYWLILVNALIFELIVSYKERRRCMRYAAAILLVIILPASYSLYKWNTLTYTPDLKISMIQPNIPFEKKIKKSYEAENMDIMTSMTSEAIKANPDLIIWPETSYPHALTHWVDRAPEPSMPEVSELARSSQTPILLGANYIRLRSKEDFDIYNAAFLVDSTGCVKEYYEKMYLVPFTEALPFKSILRIQKKKAKGVLAEIANFSSGSRFSIFEIENKKNTRASIGRAHDLKAGELKMKERFGVLICYEGLFPELSRQLRNRGADFLVCMTNDAWFGRTILPFWHASTLRLRAIENRISIARCANTGVSCFFDPAGRMYQSSEIFTKGIIIGSIIASPPLPSFYVRQGNLIIYVSYISLLIFIGISFIFKRTSC